MADYPTVAIHMDVLRWECPTCEVRNHYQIRGCSSRQVIAREFPDADEAEIAARLLAAGVTDGPADDAPVWFLVPDYIRCPHCKGKFKPRRDPT